ncbi:hypothetical protein CLOSTASPAR_00430 [[Clostridium] asparagiforme DSM 15981]|uniref:Uncharacterized protein n=1 Tax=[Clostridium] asparagiforme DSM 15981 TaxID=518636 RepID=C0CTY2_9FIRM|nr:hypothetical protein CLOSTASPAR_00430 [[Clostridium] asparagiforme DSM 15981]
MGLIFITSKISMGRGSVFYENAICIFMAARNILIVIVNT